MVVVPPCRFDSLYTTPPTPENGEASPPCGFGGLLDQSGKHGVAEGKRTTTEKHKLFIRSSVVVVAVETGKVERKPKAKRLVQMAAVPVLENQSSAN
jgi:hypothetical protein